MTDDKIERGAAEEASGTPVTPTEVEAARKPPSQGTESEPQQKPSSDDDHQDH